MALPWSHTSPAQQLIVGHGALRSMSEVLKALGVRRVLLVGTDSRIGSETGEALRAALGRTSVSIFDGVESGVPAPAVQGAVRTMRSEPVDALVSLGGGAAIDTAKAVAFFHEHESGAPAAGFADRPLLPHIAVPTTLVGAAYTGSFAMVDPSSRRSTSTHASTLVPTAVVVDAGLGADLEGARLGGSVAAALSHGIDAMWDASRDPEVEAVAAAGLARLAEWGPRSVAEPDDVELRSAVLDGSVLVGRARQHVGEGLLHSLSQLIAVRTGAPYGAVQAAVLPAIVAFTADAVPEQAEAIAVALGGSGGDPAELLRGLLDRLGATGGLDSLGVSDEDLDAIARQSGSQRGVQTHPRPVGEADIRALLDDAW